jgi:glucose-1-phosphate thymidylyltransferase
MISCPEEIAYRMGFITQEQLCKLGEELAGNSYGEYVLALASQV